MTPADPRRRPSAARRDSSRNPSSVPAPPGRRDDRWLLVTDVDDTLLGDDDALAGLLDALSTDLVVVLNSARPVPSLHRSVAGIEGDWRPFGIIGALGTQIELGGKRVRRWHRRFAGFDRRPVDELMDRLGCEPHRDEFQTPFKASFDVPPDLQPEAEERVRRARIPCRIISSGETNFDVIPERAGKGAALRYVRQVLGVPTERTVASGDSMNDLDMLGEARGIVVGNARPRLRAALDGREDVYVAGRSHAGGILEGLRAAGAPVGAGV
jgi:hydroxymethylpyrimidine pyrophosphatase-like HAD family hydrolase